MSVENPVREGREGTQGRHCEITFHPCAKTTVRPLHAFFRALRVQDSEGLVFSSRRFASSADKVSACR